jgi:23S rRNA pseudouridine2605 synthase
MSKQGLASRTQAAAWVKAGRVSVNGKVVTDPESPVHVGVDVITVEGQKAERQPRQVLMLNKPRGLLVTTHDEKGRDTVYSCFEGAELPWLAPVGRLDKASEGLLLFSNDPEWAAALSDPAHGADKTYHVQVDSIPDEAALAKMVAGVTDEGEHLAAKSAKVLRHGDKNAWLEIVLDEGRNRHIRRLLASLSLDVLRLMRVAVGGLQLGDLAKGKWRALTADEVDAFGVVAKAPAPRQPSANVVPARPPQAKRPATYARSVTTKSVYLGRNKASPPPPRERTPSAPREPQPVHGAKVQRPALSPARSAAPRDEWDLLDGGAGGDRDDRDDRGAAKDRPRTAPAEVRLVRGKPELPGQRAKREREEERAAKPRGPEPRGKARGAKRDGKKPRRW